MPFLLIGAFYLPLCEGQAATPSAYDPGHKFSQQDLRKDIFVLRQVLEQVDPGLYRYTPKAQMDTAFEEALLSVDQSMDEREFYGIVTELLSQIRDGHTRAYLASDYRKYVNATAKRFPLRVRWLSKSSTSSAAPKPKFHPVRNCWPSTGRR